LKTKFKSSIRAACLLFGGAVCAGALLPIASSTQAQNLFVSDWSSENIYEYTPAGVRSTFASGIFSEGLAFQGETLRVPEPSALGLLAAGVTALLVRRRKLAA